MEGQNAEGQEDEIDPLDAFMNDLNQSMPASKPIISKK